MIRMAVSGYAFFLLGMVVLISGPQFHHLWWWDWGTAMSAAFLGAVFLSGLRAEIRRKPPGR